MRYRSPIERRHDSARFWRRAALWCLVLVVATIADRWLVGVFLDPSAKRNDWYQTLRALGYIPLWVGVAGVVLLGERSAALARGEAPAKAWPRPRRVAVLMISAPAIAGIGAELLKVLIGRERPNAGDGWYVFKPLLSFEGGNLGLPSSHAAVAFAGAAALAARYRGTGWVLLPAAAGCALTRLLSGAHYFTDVIVGAAIGVAVAGSLAQWLLSERAE